VAACLSALSLWLAGCEPRPAVPPRLDQDRVRERFHAALDGRGDPTARVESEVVLWLRAGEAGELPGVEARVFLAAPDSVRVRVQSAFGTAFDVVARGDSMTAWVPPVRIATALDAGADSLGVRLPGELGYRLWSATWRPPAAAWGEGVRRDSLVALAWTDEAGRWSLDVGASGLPAAVALETGDGRAWRARYPQWSGAGRGARPVVIEVEAPGEFRLTARVRRSRPVAVADGRFAVRVPARTRFVERGEIAEWLGRIVSGGGAW
jgi:hypothetical protein